MVLQPHGRGLRGPDKFTNRKIYLALSSPYGLSVEFSVEFPPMKIEQIVNMPRPRDFSPEIKRLVLDLEEKRKDY